MDTWQHVIAELTRHYDVQRPRPDQLAITLTFESGRSQLVVLDSFGALGQTWACLRTRVCGEHRLDPTEALLRNREFVVGDLCIEDGVYLLKANYLLSALQPEELHLAIGVLARTADELEHALETGTDTF